MIEFHSYQGQDRFIVTATNGQRGGFFLDSGASDGRRGSNTFALERDFGWRGICVEPNDVLFERLRNQRTSVCVNCCLYDQDTDVEFFEAAEVYGGIIESYDPSHLQFAQAFVRAKGASAQAAYVRKPARSVASLLREHHVPRVIDYWSLDTEGSELAILRSFPFSEYIVRFLTVEHNNTPARREIADILEVRGFRRVAVLGIDDAYAQDDSAVPTAAPAWRSHALQRSRIRADLRHG